MGDDRIFALSCVNLYIDYKEKGTELGNDRRNSITKKVQRVANGLSS